METIQKKLTQAIEFTINNNTLKELINNFDISMGTQSNPFPVTSFTLISFPESNLPKTADQPPSLTEFYANELIKINFSLLENSEPKKLAPLIPSYRIIYCKFENIGKLFNNSDETDTNIWNEIFYVPTGMATINPNGSLFLKPDINTPEELKIRVMDSITDNYFISYSIVFSLKMKLKEEDPIAKDYYFIIDPFAKVSSGVRPY